MSELQQKRLQVKQLQTRKDNRTAKLDAINKLLKKLRASPPDIKLAATAVDYHLEKFSQEIINVMSAWLDQEQAEPVATAALVHCMLDYEQFPQRFNDWLTGMLSTGNTLDLGAKKLKLMQLVTELWYAGRKLPLDEYFGLINVALTDYYVAYYYMLGLVYHFGLYPLRSSSPQLAYGPADAAAIKKKLTTILNFSTGLFEKEKQLLHKNHKMYAQQMKKGYVLTAEIQQEQQKQRELIQLKNCLEKFCKVLEVPCTVEYKLLEPEKEQEIVRDANSGTVPALSDYVLRDFKVLLPGILFEEDVSEHFETEQKIERKQIDLVKKLAETINYKQADDLFVQFMEKFTAGQRAAIILYIIDTRQAIELFDPLRMNTLARFITSFCTYWPGFTEQVNTRLKAKIDGQSLQKPTQHLQRLLMLYSQLLKFEMVDCNKFMSIFKNILEQPSDPIYERFVLNSQQPLQNNTQTSDRAKYLFSKSAYSTRSG